MSEPPLPKKKPSGRVHLLLVVALYGSALPVAVHSWREPPPTGDWIALDFRGMELSLYLAAVGLAAALLLGHLAWRRFSWRSGLGVSVATLVLAALLVVAASGLNRRYILAGDARRASEKEAERRAVMADVERHVRLRWSVDAEREPSLFVVELDSDLDLTVERMDADGSERVDAAPQFSGRRGADAAPVVVRAHTPARVELPLGKTPPVDAVWSVSARITSRGNTADVTWSDPRLGPRFGELSLPPGSQGQLFVPLAPGVGLYSSFRADPEDGKITWRVVRVDLSRAVVRAEPVPRSRLETLGGAWPFAVNGGFFDFDLSPSGLLVVDGVEKRRFSRGGGSGVLVVAQGNAHVATAAPVSFTGVALAVQCGPRLVEPGGVNGMRSDDGKRAARTVACVRRGGTELDFVLAYDPTTLTGGPTLFRTASWLLSPLAPGDGGGCEEALNLDGGPSTGLVASSRPATEWKLPAGPVPWAIVGAPLSP